MASQAGVRQAAASEEYRASQRDDDLARRIAHGDTDAWEQFFARFSDWAYRFAYHHLDRSRADAEDLCSDIMRIAARSLRTFDSRRGALETWMLALARRRLARYCRRRRREAPLVPEARGNSPQDQPISAATDAALTRVVVNRALASLPARQAAALIAKYVTGQSVEELARLTDTTPKAVESLLSRARVAFREAFLALVSEREGGESHG